MSNSLGALLTHKIKIINNKALLQSSFVRVFSLMVERKIMVHLTIYGFLDSLKNDMYSQKTYE